MQVKEKETVIKVNKLEKKYKLYKNKKEKIIDTFTPFESGRDFFALKGINLTIKKGEVVGFVGLNGSGKSTLLNIIAGLAPSTAGDVSTVGKKSILAAKTELKGNLSARDNIYLKCLMLGFKMKEIKEMEQDIIDFSELHDFIDQPLKGFSSGMKAKLGFAISVNINPDILIIDEALSVGDSTFAEKCLEKIKEFKEQEKTIIMVTHNNKQVKEFCDRVVWLEYGSIREDGETQDVLKKYIEFSKEYKSWGQEKQREYAHKKRFEYNAK